MTIKKSLLAVATASTVAVAGAGVANADPDNAGKLPTEGNGSSVSSLEGADLGGQLAGAFGSSDTDGHFNLPQAVSALIAVGATGGAVAGSIAVLPAIYSATKDFQAYVDEFTADTQAFINSFTN
ncbi:hypothetical protein ACTXK0_12690 [Corynebacterium variabile]|uniref:hypothetical protein n=1 Tax=Corynebacterium variabile TaxID=1727 RepID=UPI003F8E0200